MGPYHYVVAQRNHLVDLARVASMAIVVIFHTLLWQVTITDGQVQVVPWAPGPVWWAISWICTIIPVFFVAAGYANAVVVDTWRASGTTYGTYLTLRGSRLLGPMNLFIGFLTASATIGAWVGWPQQAGIYSRQFAQMLWFAVVYLLLLAAAPAAVWLHDHLGAWVMVPLLVGLVAVDATVRFTGNVSLQWLNLAFVWPLAHQWGIAYHRGWFRGWPRARLMVLLGGCVGALVALVTVLGYPAAAVAWADIPVANLLPPTLAITVLGLAQTVTLALLEKARVADRISERTSRLVRLANALLLSVYLWHIPAIVIAAGILVGISVALPGSAAIAMHPLVLVLLVLLIVTLVVPQLARIEVRLIPVPETTPARNLPSVTAFALFASGTWAVWQLGTLLHPAQPASAIALAWYALGAWTLRRATIQRSG